jgi:hypothetical protein
MASKYIFKINGLPKDSEFNALPFGRQIDHLRAMESFKAAAKSIHYSAKGKTTLRAFQEFKRLYRPSQWLLVNRDAPSYHDDSFEVWYVV